MRLVEIISTTKDAIHIQWRRLENETEISQQQQQQGQELGQQQHQLHTMIHGYQVIYQAVGSLRVHKTKILQPEVNRFDITTLHESTLYDICVRTFLNQTYSVAQPGCVQGSTHTDSFIVAVGSTLGAFLALAFIVLLVYLAKRQNNDKQPYGDFYDGRRMELPLEEAILQMGDSLYIQLTRQRLTRQMAAAAAAAAAEGADTADRTQEGGEGYIDDIIGCVIDDANGDGSNRFVSLEQLRGFSELSDFPLSAEDGLRESPSILGVALRCPAEVSEGGVGMVCGQTEHSIHCDCGNCGGGGCGGGRREKSSAVASYNRSSKETAAAAYSAAFHVGGRHSRSINSAFSGDKSFRSLAKKVIKLERLRRDEYTGSAKSSGRNSLG